MSEHESEPRRTVKPASECPRGPRGLDARFGSLAAPRDDVRDDDDEAPDEAPADMLHVARVT